MERSLESYVSAYEVINGPLGSAEGPGAKEE